MKPRIMFDTGALIALERGNQQIRKVHRLAIDHGYSMVGITPVIAEWWRRGKREEERAQILRTSSSNHRIFTWHDWPAKLSDWSRPVSSMPW
jgi:hypothetical protein